MPYHRVLSKVPVPNISAFRIWQVCEHARVKQGAEYTCICLNNFSIYMKMFDNAEYDQIFRHISEKTEC